LQQASTRLRELSANFAEDSSIAVEAMVKFGKPFHEIAEVAKNGRRPHHLDAEDVNKGE
jgi:hypothetical protein